MNDERLIEVKIGQLPIKVPVYRDQETTQSLVDRINARILLAEKQIGRIDSYAAAVLSVFLYAREADEARRELGQERERASIQEDTDDAELLRALSHIAEALEGLLKTARSQEVESPERA